MELASIIVVLFVTLVVVVSLMTLGVAGLAFLPIALWLRLRQGFGIAWLLGMTALAAFLFWLWRTVSADFVILVLMLIGLGLLGMHLIETSKSDRPPRPD